MTERKPKQVIELALASSLSEEQLADRKALTNAEEQTPAEPLAAESSQSANILEREQLLRMADGLLYATEKCCEEYLPNKPPHLVTALNDLREAVEKREL